MTGTILNSQQRQRDYFMSLIAKWIIVAVVGVVGMLVFGIADLANDKLQFFISPTDWLDLLWKACLAITLTGLALAIYYGRKLDKIQ